MTNTTTHTAAPIAYTKDRPTSPGLYLCWHEGDRNPIAYSVVEQETGLCADLPMVGGVHWVQVKSWRFDGAYWHKLPDNLGWNPHDDN